MTGEEEKWFRIWYETGDGKKYVLYDGWNARSRIDKWIESTESVIRIFYTSKGMTSPWRLADIEERDTAVVDEFTIQGMRA